MRIEDDDPEHVVINKATTVATALGAQVSVGLLFLRYPLGADPSDSSVLELDSRLRRAAVSEALERYRRALDLIEQANDDCYAEQRVRFLWARQVNREAGEAEPTDVRVTGCPLAPARDFTRRSDGL